ncbi:hypothetical protein [Pedobacter frigoris]|uniref:hypothetical protein n=1 Tax=Pedobacter frigoris TaxID=2571272 RepID=UPI0029315740|nr:hypothetical protein [Pedobacter frigoris]
MTKKKLTLRTLEHDDSLEVISKVELSTFMGGDISNDCIIRCFDYLDGAGGSYSTYYNYAISNLGYTAQSAGIQNSDISQLGAVGYLSVNELDASAGIQITGSGRTVTGERIMMVIDGGTSGVGHAVAVTGASTVGGVSKIQYYDPTTGLPGEMNAGDFSRMYAVGPMMAN